MPLLNFSIANSQVTDNGFKYLIQRFEAIYLKNVQTGREIVEGMHFNFSNNTIGESSVRFFAEILKKFHGFRSVDMRSLLMKGKNASDSGYSELARAIKENNSLVELDIRHNFIPEHQIAKILNALADNYVLSELKLDIKTRRTPNGFSSYPI